MDPSGCFVHDEALRCLPPLSPGGLRLTHRALSLAGLQPGDLLLDVGCGTGETAHYAGAVFRSRVIGIDPRRMKLQHGGQSGFPPRILQACAERLPFRSAVFDAVVCQCVLCLVPCSDQAIQEMGRVLKPDATAVVCDLYAGKTAGGGRLPDMLGERFEAAGFCVDVFEDHSDVLKEIYAMMIFAPLTPAAEDALKSCKKRDAGYYLLIARKEVK